MIPINYSTLTAYSLGCFISTILTTITIVKTRPLMETRPAKRTEFRARTTGRRICFLVFLAAGSFFFLNYMTKNHLPTSNALPYSVATIICLNSYYILLVVSFGWQLFPLPLANPWRSDLAKKPMRSVPFILDIDKTAETMSGTVHTPVIGSISAKTNDELTVSSFILDEGKIPKIVDYKRIRSAIEHENSLIDKRMTWLLGSHGFLLAAFGLFLREGGSPNTGFSLHSRGEISAILYAVAMIGFLVCLCIAVSVKCATLQICRLEEWWYANYQILRAKLRTFDSEQQAYDYVRHRLADYSYEREIENDQPPINGIFTGGFVRIFSISGLPWYFLMLWLSLIVVVTDLSTEPSNRTPSSWTLYRHWLHELSSGFFQKDLKTIGIHAYLFFLTLYVLYSFTDQFLSRGILHYRMKTYDTE